MKTENCGIQFLTNSRVPRNVRMTVAGSKSSQIRPVRIENNLKQFFNALITTKSSRLANSFRALVSKYNRDYAISLKMNNIVSVQCTEGAQEERQLRPEGCYTHASLAQNKTFVKSLYVTCGRFGIFLSQFYWLILSKAWIMIFQPMVVKKKIWQVNVLILIGQD